ncbi:MAG: type sorting protein, partial [Sediminibacterium sp.]|nr:type sorting protein [Sediminibacterium sp.]
MKKWFFIMICMVSTLPAAARHVAGGELFYEYLGPGINPNSSVYRITLRLFRDCTSTGPLLENEPVTVGIYSNGARVEQLPLPRIDAIRSISLNTGAFPCLMGPPVSVCYEIGIYSSTITLTNTVNGYILSRIGCCRVDRISNLSQATNVGSDYVTQIPGTNALPQGHNSSPQFYVRDTALVCANKSFKLDFGATDLDNDSLTYSFCDAYTSGNGGNNVPPPSNLNLISLPYLAPYNGNFPLGSKVKINPGTGLISGIAPREGSYVVNVCVTEWRDGKAFTGHRKDFILKVQNCDFIEAVLPEKIIQCKDFTVHFENLSSSAAITSYQWDFGDNHFSSDPVVDYTYADTGRYIARLVVTGPKSCVGEASTEVIVFPGFEPAFSVNNGCYLNPFQFKDLTTTVYGVVDSWRWDFGDDTTLADTSILKNPRYLYRIPALKDIGLVVTNSKGCIDSLHKSLVVRDKPLIQLPFKDTLICSIDTLAIPVGNPGVYSWKPDKNIIGANTSRPLVFPKDTTRYYVTVNDSGCVNTDSVTINVLSYISVYAGRDSLICLTDAVHL